MRKIFIFSVLVLLYANSFAQVTFDPGYFIDNTGKRIECLIRNPDRIANPVKFEYKESENAPVKTAEIESVSAFEIINTVHKYERHKVLLERSSRNINKLSTLNEIKFNEEVVFLRVLIEGKSNLYAFYANSGDVEKFFYKTESSEVKPLISYFYQNDMGELKENNSFRQELLTNLESNAVSLKSVTNLRYTLKSLISFFVKYNQSFGTVYTDNISEKLNGGVHFSVKGGMNVASLELKQTERNTTFTTQLDSKISPVIALEFEYVLPFNKNKWSVYVEPTFQHYKTNSEFAIYYNISAPSAPSSPPGSNTSGNGNATITYSHISFPLGLKHSFLLNKGAKLYMSGSVAYVIVLNSENVFQEKDLNPSYYGAFRQDKTTPVPYYNLAIGYSSKNKLTVKAEGQFGKQMMQKDNWEAKFRNSFSILLGYRLF